jgi:hypothetical protein
VCSAVSIIMVKRIEERENGEGFVQCQLSNVTVTVSCEAANANTNVAGRLAPPVSYK